MPEIRQNALKMRVIFQVTIFEHRKSLLIPIVLQYLTYIAVIDGKCVRVMKTTIFRCKRVMFYFPAICIKYPHEFINKRFITRRKPFINFERKDVLCNRINRIDVGVIYGIESGNFQNNIVD